MASLMQRLIAPDELVRAIQDFVDELLTGLTRRKVCGLVTSALVCKLLWTHYGVLLCRRKLPYLSLGWPLLGHTPDIFRQSLEGWAEGFLVGKPPAILANFLFCNTVMVQYPLYLKHIHQAEIDGMLRPQFPPSLQTLLGNNSVLVLPGGKGHPHHKRLRAKLLSSLAPKPTLAILPEIITEVRKTLDGLGACTAADGFASFNQFAQSLAATVSTLQITAGLSKELQDRVTGHLDCILEGLFSLPINAGRFSTFGRALRARKELSTIIQDLLAAPIKDKRNIIHDLTNTSDSVEAFTPEEVSDTVATLLLAGKLTTADALPHLFVLLNDHPEWVSKIACEDLHVDSIESDSAALRFVLECLRVKPPAGGVRRVCSHAIDLGEYGHVPPNCQMVTLIGHELKGMGSFDPDRWTPDFVRKNIMLPFGGNQPHNCVGRSLALLELQTFARVLCREYEFKALEPELIVKPSLPLSRVFKDGLRVSVTRRT